MHAFGTLLALSYGLWAAGVAFGAGWIGAGLTGCEERDQGCKEGFPSPFEPWAWGDHYVYPEVTFIAVAGFIAATACVVFVSSGFGG